MTINTKVCKSVLVVENDRSVREMVREGLELEGYQVITANDDHDGIEKIKVMNPKPCAILLDLPTPGANLQTFLDFQRADPTLSFIPVIVCSAYVASAQSVRANAVIAKPIRLQSLLETVKILCSEFI